MGLFDAIASTVGNLTDNVVGMVNQNHQNKVNLRMMREQNAFNAEQSQIQRDWQEKMWDMNNAYNSPDAMISRGLNPFIQGSAAMAGSKPRMLLINCSIVIHLMILLMLNYVSIFSMIPIRLSKSYMNMVQTYLGKKVVPIIGSLLLMVLAL
jgi:uncharacterized membrane protein